MELNDYLVLSKKEHTPFNKDKEYKHLYKRGDETSLGKSFFNASMYPLTSIKIYAKSAYEKEAYERNYIVILNEFKKKLLQEGKYFEGFTETSIYNYFKEIYLKLIKLNADNILFDLTDDSSIFFQSNILDFTVYVELYLDTESNELPELILNLYKNSEIELAFGGSVDEVFRKIENKISENNLQSDWILSTYSSDEKIPQSAFATETF